MEPLIQILSGSAQRAPWGWALLVVVTLAVIRAWPSLKKLQITENLAIRREYVKELQSLRAEVRALTQENGELRDEIRQLHGLLQGYQRQDLAGQAAIVAHAGAIAPEAAKRAERMLRDNEDDTAH